MHKLYAKRAFPQGFKSRKLRRHRNSLKLNIKLNSNKFILSPNWIKAYLTQEGIVFVFGLKTHYFSLNQVWPLKSLNSSNLKKLCHPLRYAECDNDNGEWK